MGIFFRIKKCFLQKLVNISGLFKARFIRHYGGDSSLLDLYVIYATYYEIFKALNLNEQIESEKKAYFDLFFFY